MAVIILRKQKPSEVYHIDTVISGGLVWRWCAKSYDAAFVLVGDYVPPIYTSIENLETLCPGVWAQAWEAVGTP